MTKKVNSAFVQMPSSTVAALKAMLFNSNEGVDLSSIINDISGNNGNENLVAINVALAFRGYKPELDDTIRVINSWEWGGTITTGKMISMSLIVGTVEVMRTEHKYNIDTKNWEAKEIGIDCMDFGRWCDLEPSLTSDAWELVSQKQEQKAKENA